MRADRGLDPVTHYPGTGGPLADPLAVAAGIPAASVATLLAARLFMIA